MNYFAHGYRFTDSPYLLAGTAIPDALGTINRRIRVRRKQALPFVDDCDPIVAAIATGIVQHHDDDAWFHGQRAFVELSLAFAQEIRALLADDKGLRAGFLGHIIVELLLDAELIRKQPSGSDAYYQSLGRVDGILLQQIVGRFAGRPVHRLADFLDMFRIARFLDDYSRDDGLLMRLNQIMRRVGLAEINEALPDWFASARIRVNRRIGELMPESVRTSTVSPRSV